MKLTVIGGGGVRSLFLAKSIALQAKELGIRELVLMDNNAEKLEIFGSLAKDVAAVLEPELKVRLTNSGEEAVRDANYVITTIRVGEDQTRVADEQIARKYGLLAQETTGACGFSFALRSIPVLVTYCELIRKLAKPSVKVFNFTNPAGLVSQALRYAGFGFTYGICDAPTSLLSQIAAMKGVSPEQIDAECFGLNHLSWFPLVRINGEDVTTELIRDPRLYRETDCKFFEPELFAGYQALFNEYLYYYYYREQAVENIDRAGATRGEQILGINQEMIRAFRAHPGDAFEERLGIFEEYYARREDSYMAAETGKKRESHFHFDLFGSDAGGYAGVALNYIRIIQQGKPGRMIISLPNQGAIPFLESDDVAELSCTVTATGEQPDPVEKVHPTARELIRRMKCYERWAAEAILQQNYDLCVQALQLHPLIESYSLAKSLTADFFALNRPWIHPAASK